MLTRTSVICGMLIIAYAPPTYAGICGEGYGLDESGQCVACNNGWYCPDDDSDERLPCPYADKDFFIAHLNSIDIADVESIETGRASWYDPGDSRARPAYSIDHCWYQLYITTSRGQLYMQQQYRTGQYWSNSRTFWFAANPGYYLKDFYTNLSRGPSYLHIVTCDNKPAEYAYYTGPGEPDVGNCPWACDSEYGRHGDECLPLCRASITKLHAGEHTYNLYADKHTEHAIVIQHGNNNSCYVNLESGAAGNALNVIHNDIIYHALD